LDDNKNDEENRNTCLSYDKLQPNMKKRSVFPHIFFPPNPKYFRFTTNTFVFVFLRFMEIITESRPWPSNIRFKIFFTFSKSQIVSLFSNIFCLFEKLSGSSMLMEGVARNFKLDFGFDQKIKKQNSHLNAYCAML